MISIEFYSFFLGFFISEEALLSNNIYDYHYVSQGKVCAVSIFK